MLFLIHSKNTDVVIIAQLSSSGKTPEQHIRTIRNYLQRIKTGDIDTQGFRKLASVVRDNPVRAALQESNGDGVVHNDIWDGGVIFEDLLTAIFNYLGNNSVSVLFDFMHCKPVQSIEVVTNAIYSRTLIR